MRSSRPKNLNLFTIRFPIPAIVSILHRLSGAFLFLLIPFILWALQVSLTYDGFDTIQQFLSNGYVRALVWILLAPFLYHLVAGVRHLLSDLHLGVSLKAGRMASMLTIVISALIILFAGIWLW